MSSPSVRPPHIHTLDRTECLRLLSAHEVGRIAYAFDDQVDIEPIHYLHSHGWLYGRTSEGAKLAAIAHNRWVAFEVDEVRGTFDWASVVVRGAFYRLASDGTPADRARWERAVAAIRTLTPEAFGEGDPTPERSAVFRIHAGEVTGRAARSAAGAGAPAA